MFLGLIYALSPAVQAADDGGWGDDADWGDVGDIQQPIFETKLYGFIDSYFEKVAQTPVSVDEQGRTVWEDNPYEFDVLNLNVMLQGSIHGRYRYFLNLAAPGAGSNVDDEALSVRNAWVEAPIMGSYLAVRAGKLYRRFGLYNEILDAVPTFIGIEPPELFDKDHLMVTRTTNLMVFGALPIGGSTVNYAVSTGNDERDGGAVPIGADANIDFGGRFRVGSSFYSSMGDAAPSRGVGEGSPRGGVINWMETDNYVVYGGYAQLTYNGTTIQAEGWQADHDAVRDGESVAALADAGLNPRQEERFLPGGEAVEGPVKYAIRTAYLRAGHQFPVGKEASFTPYIQGDYYSNPETIANKDFGGDNEAGLSDDGVFYKYTAGAVIRPVPQVALKLDGSAHQMQFNGETTYFPEVRVSLSYLWQLEQ